MICELNDILANVMVNPLIHKVVDCCFTYLSVYETVHKILCCDMKSLKLFPDSKRLIENAHSLKINSVLKSLFTMPS